MNTIQRTRTQLHVSIDTRDLERSRAFYRALFGEEAVLAKPDYLRFWPAELGLVLGLNRRTKERGSTGPMRHLGLLFPNPSALADAHARLDAAGFATHGEANTTCCYARLDQFWSTDPSGVEWELFLSHEDEIEEPEPAATRTCCAPDCCS
jgi:catechol 2,3-dioxygenase-like lactoylglutathione lyase family enzyme